MSAEIKIPTVSNDKPRVALMGEFSAGKSTLANILLGSEHSPVRATATRLPPVWYGLGPHVATRVTDAGEAVPIPFETWAAESHDDSQLISVGLGSEVLETIDLIDMPGTSDPNLEVQYWKTLMPQVDIVLWLTPANQAWRQTEAALWAETSPELRRNSLLLVTRMDQIQSETDRQRLLQRVKREAGAEFRAVLPVSLTEAQRAPNDERVLEASGMADMIQALLASLDQVARRPRAGFIPVGESPQPARNRPGTPDTRQAAVSADDRHDIHEERQAADAPVARVVPRRVVRRAKQPPARAAR